MSRFEVRKDGRVLASGPATLLYPPEIMKQMRAAGYRIYVDGKVLPAKADQKKAGAGDH